MNEITQFGFSCLKADFISSLLIVNNSLGILK